MSSVSSIALSGLRAAESRLTAAASNIANASTTGRVPTGASQTGDVYRPVDVVQVSLGSGDQPGGVATSYSPRDAGYGLVYDPTSPVADAKGNVATPQVDVAAELVQASLAKYEYLAAAKILGTESDMQQSVIDTVA